MGSMLFLVCVVEHNKIAQAADQIITITFSDAGGNANGLITDFAVATGFTTTISDGMGGTIPNPQTRLQYSADRLKLHMRETIKAYRANTDVEKTRKKTLDDTEAVIIFK